MRGTAKRWPGDCAKALRQVRWTVCGAAVPKRVRRTMCGAAAPRQVRRAACRAAALKHVRQIVYCTMILALCLLLCGDMVLPPQQEPFLPELSAVERQLRALTADAPDGWRYSLRVSPGPGGTALTADAARRDASGAWETIHTLWLPENGAWRMVRQTRQRHAPMPGIQGERTEIKK